MEKRNFKARKWLLDMAVGYTRLLETSRCKYQNIKTTTHQLKLMGKGDMLFSPQGAPRPMRVQGAFVSDGDVQKVVDYIREDGFELTYSKEIAEQIVRGTDTAAADTGSSRDELFANAGRFIIDKKKASIGNLQRMFKIGFNRAARIMDQLSEAGVVGEEQGTKPREILMTAEQFEELLRQTQ